jgi:beta-N-acetylhexosaminidase
MPSDVPAAIDAVVAGIQEGRFTQARIDSSVRRLLVAKERAGLNRRRLVDLDSIRSIVGDSSNTAIAALAAEKSITLAKDSLRLVPLAQAGGRTTRILIITLAHRSDLGAGVSFVSELRRGMGAGARMRAEYVNPDDPGANFGRLLAAADSVDLVIVGSYLAPSYAAASAGTAAPVIDFIHALTRRRSNTILVNFGNPYLFQQVPEISTYVVAWGGFPLSQRAAARALLGATPITGLLPISIPPSLRFGAGETRSAVPRPATSLSQP